MALSRFRQANTAEEEVNLVQNAVLKSTQDKNKSSYGILGTDKKEGNLSFFKLNMQGAILLGFIDWFWTIAVKNHSQNPIIILFRN